VHCSYSELTACQCVFSQKQVHCVHSRYNLLQNIGFLLSKLDFVSTQRICSWEKQVDCSYSELTAFHGFFFQKQVHCFHSRYNLLQNIEFLYSKLDFVSTQKNCSLEKQEHCSYSALTACQGVFSQKLVHCFHSRYNINSKT